MTYSLNLIDFVISVFEIKLQSENRLVAWTSVMSAILDMFLL